MRTPTTRSFSAFALSLSLVLVAAGAGTAGLVTGCSPTSRQIRPSSPFTPGLARYFDDAVDYVQSADGLGGRLADDWNSQMDGLSRYSDLIGVVRIETVVQGTNPDGSRSYRLAAAVAERVKGEAPEDGHVSLHVSEGQTGFNTVDGKEARLQSGRYLLFVKWYSDSSGQVAAHWHLTPFTDALMARVRRASGLEAAQLGEERVVRQEGSHAPRPFGNAGDGGASSQP
jgi:hypothetical protein